MEVEEEGIEMMMMREILKKSGLKIEDGNIS